LKIRLTPASESSSDMHPATKPLFCAHPPRGAEPIDLTHLRRFTLGDKRLEEEILKLFIEQAPATIEAMKRARTKREWATAAHTLKGSARAVGAWRIAELAESAERLKGPSDRPACDLALRHLEEAAGEARAHIVAQSGPC
jgi:HPt (histidine-containing phosphotransfer) domain-containing protein